MTTTTRDLAADSPLTYEQMHAAHKAGTLGATLAALTPIQRVGAAAVVAERMGRDVSNVLLTFGREIERHEAQIEQRPADLDWATGGHDAETADELLPPAAAPAATTTLIINRSGLDYAQIAVTADSWAERAEQDVRGTLYLGVLADGRFYPLVRRKHTLGRPEWLDAVDAVAADVRHAAATLRNAAQPTPAPAGRCDWCSAVGPLARVEVAAQVRSGTDVEADSYDAWLCPACQAVASDDAPDPTPSPPALTSCRVRLPDGGWASLDATGRRVIWSWAGNAQALRAFIAGRAA